MPDLQSPDPGQGLPTDQAGADPAAPSLPQQEMQSDIQHNRGADYYEAQSIKWNVARIVRLSSGRFALLSPYNESAIDLISVGTLEEIAGLIPTYDECVSYCERAKPVVKRSGPRGTAELLADIGL